MEYFHKEGKLIELQRIEERTQFDLEMIQELGYCNGIENYSRHLTGRKPGEPPPTLLDYFPDDFLFFIDESLLEVVFQRFHVRVAVVHILCHRLVDDVSDGLRHLRIGD